MHIHLLHLIYACEGVQVRLSHGIIQPAVGSSNLARSCVS